MTAGRSLTYFWIALSFYSGAAGAALGYHHGAPDFIAPVLPYLGFIFGVFAPTMLLMLVIATSARLATRHRHPTRSLGIRTARETADRESIDWCVWCDAEDVAGVETTARREFVVGGVTVWTLDEAGATDCRTCHDDLHRAIERARSDDPPPLRANGRELTRDQQAFQAFVRQLQAVDDPSDLSVPGPDCGRALEVEAGGRDG